MTTPDTKIAQWADALWHARSSGEPIDALSKSSAPPTLEEAYLVQRMNTARGQAEGRRVCGRKIGLTSLAVQERFGVKQPDFGALFADMNVAEGIPISAGSLIQPQAEVELAFMLGRGLDMAQPTIADVIHAVEYVVPAIEIVDSRIKDWDISITDTVADNASSGLFVVGGPVRRIDDLDMLNCRMLLEKNGESASSGDGAACLGHPLNAVRWLATTMHELGDPLRAGDIVLSGAMGPLVPVSPGDELFASISGIGTVRAIFAKQDKNK